MEKTRGTLNRARELPENSFQLQVPTVLSESPGSCRLTLSRALRNEEGESNLLMGLRYASSTASSSRVLLLDDV